MDLSLIPTEELIDATLDRFPHAIFAATKEEGINNTRLLWRIRGQEIMCRGLYEKLGDMVHNEFESEDDES